MFSFLNRQQEKVAGAIEDALRHDDTKAEISALIHPQILDAYDKDREDLGPVAEVLDFVGDLTRFAWGYSPLGETHLATNVLSHISRYLYMRREFSESKNKARKENLQVRMHEELFRLNQDALALMSESQTNVDNEISEE